MKSRPITFKLVIAFVALIGILLGIGWLGLSRLAVMNDNLQEITERRWAKVQLAREALRYSALNSRITLQVFLLDDSQAVDALLEQRANNTARISELLKRIEAGLESETEKALVAAVWTNRNPYVQSYQRALSLLLQEGQPAAGREMMAKVVTPNLIAYHKTWEDFVAFQGERMDRAGNDAEAHYVAARRLVLLLLTLALILACAIAVFVTRGTSKEICNRLQAEQGLREAREALERRVEERTAELRQASRAVQANEARLRAITDSAQDAILMMDPEGRVSYWNPAAEHILGYTSAEAMGQNLHKLIVPERFHPAHHTALPAFLQTGQGAAVGKTLDLDARRKDGQEILVQLSLSAVQMDGGWHAVGIIRDITERKQAEESLRLQSAALEAAANAIVITDRNGTIQSVNPAFTALTGYTAQEAVGQNPRVLKSGKQDESFFRNLWQTISSGRVWSGELTNRRKDGSFYDEEMTITPLRNADGVIARYIAIKQNITGRRRMEKVQSCLSQLAYQLSLLSDAPPAARLVADAAQDLLGWDACFLRLRSPDLARVQYVFNIDTVEGRRVEVPASSEPTPPGRLEERVMRDGAQIILRSSESDGTPGLVTFGDTGRHSASLLFVPLRHRGQHLGLFSIQSYRAGAYDRAALDLLQTLADHAAGALERIRAEQELENLHKQLLEASRRGGMAEIATNVLHNVGNVLNSVNISTGLLIERVKKSRASSLVRVVVLLQEHAHDLGAFISNDSRGKHVPAHLAQLSEHLMADQEAIVSELDSLRQNVDHIKGIVAMQQNYATVGGVKEMINVVNLVEDSLRLIEGALSRHCVEVIREFETVPPMNVEKHKILQILVNLLRNAKHACQDSERADKQMTVRVANGGDRIRISVIDNGVGIPPENLTRIFNYGFTTRKEGHGFGLHSGALAAKEMGGSLAVHCAGPGQGTAFTLELPCPTRESSHE